MPSGHPKPVTAAQIAMYGHIAARVRAFVDERGWNAVRLTKELGLKGDGPTYKWLASKAGPGPKSRVKLAKLMGIKPEELMKRLPGTPSPLVMAAQQQLIPRKSVSDVLQFNVDSEGEARLRLDVKLPIEQGTSLLRILLDAGVVLSPKREDSE